MSQSYSQPAESNISQSRQFRSQQLEASAREGGDDEIEESIAMEESYAPSSSASKIHKSDNLKESSVGKASRSNRTDKIDEKDKESENSLERDETETYSEDFASQSIQSSKTDKNRLRSGQALA